MAGARLHREYGGNRNKRTKTHMITSIIGAIIGGTFTGLLARAVLPGTQNIGWGKTIGLGVVANLIVGIFFGAIAGPITGIILGVAVGAGLLWFAIKQGWLTSTS